MTITLPHMALNVFGNTVSLVLITGSNYEAQVVFDDLAERFRRGERINFGVSGVDGSTEHAQPKNDEQGEQQQGISKWAIGPDGRVTGPIPRNAKKGPDKNDNPKGDSKRHGGALG
jgi:hypothetical protein